MSQVSRRAFLKQTAAMSAMGSALPLGVNLSAITQAAAQSAPSDYRALVCIFMYGGNDAYNTVLATDSTSWTHYVNHRNPRLRNPQDSSTSIALLAPGTTPDNTASGGSPEKLGGVLPINHAGRAVHTGRQFAMHPALAQVQQLHQAGRVAVLANVGPLTRPTTKADWSNARFEKPAKLFSHNDQQATWQSFGVEGSTEGWAGRMGDLLMAGNATSAGANMALIQRSFTCMTPAGASVWMNGRAVLPYQTSSSGIPSLGTRTYGYTQLQTALSNIMSSASSSNYLVQDHQQLVQRSFQAGNLLSSRLPVANQAPWGTPGSGNYNAYSDPMLQYMSPTEGSTRFNSLAAQLQMVARLIDVNRSAGLGIKRQFFMVSLNGLDTHDNQNQAHADVMAQLNHAMAYFDTLLGNMPGGSMRNQVTTFTASEFGRSFTNNGDGTDHGWGSHHLIMGGAVRGTEVYGTFPQYSTADANGVFASPDQIQNGVMLPSTSVDQYAYTLGKWMGVSPTDLASILPNLSQFNSNAYDLGFML
ncbi:MAG TPA: DUF1501 domain-containing protein [Aquabacterium sp.]|uniref:DUF1501 domain-containing protein n=1 Tax=Aquabacterium sp. TaxID=1872578 RepID=UPI002E2F2C88|nr:DUF1501 domain-containing protein [Aquabacterium sp.]HEX5357503.1 DUF1501 domain-containing protein [Aquabacterium sp.]